MTLPPQSEHKTSATIDLNTVELPTALLQHVEAKRISAEEAEILAEELKYQTDVISFHRDERRRSNLYFLNNNLLAEPLDPDRAILSGDAKKVVQMLPKFATAATERFKMPPSHVDIGRKRDIAFDYGHIDQEGDWLSPTDIDALITKATDEEFLRKQLKNEEISVVRHERTHEKISYKFWLSTLNHAVMVIRKRPIADIFIGSVCVQVFRKSWFLVRATDEDPIELQRCIKQSRPDQKQNEDAMAALIDKVDQVLASTYEEKAEQAYVIPCTMTYVARVLGPAHTQEEQTEHDS